MNNKTLLVITDGIGFNPDNEHNAFYHAKKPAYDYLFKEVPYNYIKTFGMSVGLPDGQMGNSEVGHMSIGSGRVLYQDLVKINMAIQDTSISENGVLKSIVDRSEKIHLVGLLSDGGVHSHIKHISSIAKIIAAKGKSVCLHLITDGRDVSPTSAPKYIEEIEAILDNRIAIATIGGRFYGMDRDNRWDRIEKAYRCIAEGENQTSLTPSAYIENCYENDVTDEFIEPASFGGYPGLCEDDGVIFCNFRSDRMREIVTSLGDKEFNEFERKEQQINIATMTEYNKAFPYPVMFTKETPKNTLSEVISKAGLRQMHTSETEKYAHVTFFFNGGVDEPFENETRVLIPSPNVKTYDEKPEMSAPEVSQAVQKAMKEEYDFIVVNFANGDMVGHTGDYHAGIKAVEAVDKELGDIISLAKETGYNLVLTSDHGNCEMMRDKDGNILTNHTVGEVYCFVMADGVTEVKTGALNNIAPTVLKLMNIDIPQEMDEALI